MLYESKIDNFHGKRVRENGKKIYFECHLLLCNINTCIHSIRTSSNIHTGENHTRDWFNFTICLWERWALNLILNSSINWTVWTISEWWLLYQSKLTKSPALFFSSANKFQHTLSQWRRMLTLACCLNIFVGICIGISWCVCRLNSISTHLFRRNQWISPETEWMWL